MCGCATQKKVLSVCSCCTCVNYIYVYRYCFCFYVKGTFLFCLIPPCSLFRLSLFSLSSFFIILIRWTDGRRASFRKGLGNTSAQNEKEKFSSFQRRRSIELHTSITNLLFLVGLIHLHGFIARIPLSIVLF